MPRIILYNHEQGRHRFQPSRRIISGNRSKSLCQRRSCKGSRCHFVRELRLIVKSRDAIINGQRETWREPLESMVISCPRLCMCSLYSPRVWPFNSGFVEQIDPSSHVRCVGRGSSHPLRNHGQEALDYRDHTLNGSSILWRLSIFTPLWIRILGDRSGK